MASKAIASSSLQARYRSKCRFCYQWIDVGQYIRWSEGYGSFIHDWCEPPMSDSDDEILEDHGDR